MLKIEGSAAYKNLKQGIRKRTFRIPSKDEAAYVDGCVLPRLTPKFQIEPQEQIFTIGSCFAREIEGLLVEHGFDLPVGAFTVDAAEFALPGPHLLNEYNAGTILQRFESVFDLFTYDDDRGVEETADGVIDLFLHVYNRPVSKQRLHERRAEIDDLYRQIKTSDTLIITMGLVECWYDAKYECYLNKAPSARLVSKEPGRYFFHQMDVEDVYVRLEKSITLLNQLAMKKIIVTVSPIPIEATFTDTNVIMANSYSKSVLRIVAEKLKNKFINVDYFPSLEIATSAGLAHFEVDNIHLKTSVVELITNHMLTNYCLLMPLGGDQTFFVKNYLDEDYTA